MSCSQQFFIYDLLCYFKLLFSFIYIRQYLSTRGGANPRRTWNFEKKKKIHNLSPLSNTPQELPVPLQNSPSKVSSRLRSCITSSNDYGMDIDEAGGPETSVIESTDEAFNRLYGSWARSESSTKESKGDIKMNILKVLSIEKTKYYELRTKWLALQFANVTVNIEDVSENCTLTSNTLSIPGIQVLLSIYILSV